MHSSFSLAAIILGATITPGPNNFAILRISASHGPGAVCGLFRAIAAIVIGGLCLYALLHSGLEAGLKRYPMAEPLLLSGSAAYLVWMGGSLIYQSCRSGPGRLAALPASWPALLLFQLVNPKGWALMASVAAAAHCRQRCNGAEEAVPVLLLTMIPAASLLAWHGLGVAAQRHVAVDMRNRHVLRIAGVVLMASALPLLR